MSGLGPWVEGLAEGRRGTLVQAKPERWVWRVEEDGRAWYAKRGVGSKAREVRREAACAETLARRGHGAGVLATGRRPDGTWLVTADAARAATPVADLLAGGGRRAADLAGAAIRSFHDAGLSFPDLTAPHVFVAQDPPRLLLIDVARLGRHRGAAPAAARARDLAALLFSLERCGRRLLTRTGRARLVRAATGLGGDGLRRFLRRVEREAVRLASRTRWRHRHSWADGPDVLAALGAADGATAYERLTDLRRWRIVRTLPDRTNLRLDLRGRPFLHAKAYPPGGSRRSPAMQEFQAIERFLRAGIPVNRVAAHAEDVERGSLLAVRACAGEPLDDLLRRGVTRADRRSLAVATARIWRRLRECGLRHRDAYPCHVFAARGDRGFDLRLIDLTRAGPAPLPRERWFVKDAAALWHGCPRPPVTRTDAVRWLREYFRVPRLTAGAKRFARRVAAKERRIAARQARRRERVGR